MQDGGRAVAAITAEGALPNHQRDQQCYQARQNAEDVS